MSATVDLSQYIGKLIDEVREARKQRDAQALDVIVDKVKWVHEQLEQQQIRPNEDWATLQRQLEASE
jgi:hypothetical protein